MQIEFDPEKDRINCKKHGISLSMTARMDFDRTMVVADERHDYGEARFWAIGPIDDRLHILAFTMRHDTLRAISLRKANKRERQRYERS